MPSKMHVSSLTLFLLSCTAGVAGATEIEFVPQEPTFSESVGEYQAIWETEGERIVNALETATGLRLEVGPIRAIVCECVSNSGYRETPMQLRASYPGATKRATLVHELSHRLIADVAPESVDQHQVIFLFVYDVWAQLWGKEVGIASEVDGLPIGRARQYWSAEGLEREDRKLAVYESTVKGQVREACRNEVARFSGKPRASA